MKKLGLLGKDISYSFSRTYFKKKFEDENINNITYENFDIENIKLFPSIIENTQNLKGLNVTIPYKEQVMPFLDKINKKAKAIGAVNTIRITKKNQIIINCTPLGTFPNVDACPNIPYAAINEHHILFDLIYNPAETRFLQEGKQKKATLINGLNMLRLQAEKSWAIWDIK